MSGDLNLGKKSALGPLHLERMHGEKETGLCWKGKKAIVQQLFAAGQIIDLV